MLKNIDGVKRAELIRDLSPEAIAYFTETELSDEWPKHQMFNRTKFVRLGAGDASRIVLGSTIDYGPLEHDRYNKDGRRATIMHKNLHAYAGQNLGLTEEDRQRMLESREERRSLSGDGLMLDAGRATIVEIADALPLVAFSGSSIDFGRADEAGRMETADVARTILGDNFEVTAVIQ